MRNGEEKHIKSVVHKTELSICVALSDTVWPRALSSLCSGTTRFRNGGKRKMSLGLEAIVMSSVETAQGVLQIHDQYHERGLKSKFG